MLRLSILIVAWLWLLSASALRSPPVRYPDRRRYEIGSVRSSLPPPPYKSPDWIENSSRSKSQSPSSSSNSTSWKPVRRPSAPNSPRPPLPYPKLGSTSALNSRTCPSDCPSLLPENDPESTIFTRLRHSDQPSSGTSKPSRPIPILTKPTNATCGGCTINVRQAWLDWWYPDVFNYVIATITTQYNSHHASTALGLKSNTRPFDISAAMESVTWSETVVWNKLLNTSSTQLVMYTLPQPAAFFTSIYSRTAVLPFPTTRVTNADTLTIDPSPASIAIGGATPIAFTSATPFVYFNNYEVERNRLALGPAGRVWCQTVTHVYNMSAPYAFAYETKGLEALSAATGVLPNGFARQAALPWCSLGTWEAYVTVVVVVDLVYGVQFVPAIAHIESTVTGPLIVPTPEETSTSKLQTTRIHPTTGGDHDPPPLSSPPPVKSSVSILQLPSASSPGNIIKTIASNPTFQTSHVESTKSNPDPGSTEPPGKSISEKSTPQVLGETSHSHITPLVAHVESSVLTITPLLPTQTATTVTVDGSVVVATIESQLLTRTRTRLPVVITFGSQVITGSSLDFVIGTQTVRPGGPGITVSNTLISIASPATAVVIDGTTTPIQLPSQVATNLGDNVPVLTIGTRRFTGNAATQFFITEGQTLTVGGVATLSGTAISLAPSASFLVVGEITQILAPPPTRGVPIITFGGTLFVPNAGSSFLIGGETLTPGGVATLDKTVVSLDNAASTFVVNGMTFAIGSMPVSMGGALVVGHTTYTAGADSVYTIDGQALSPNGVITADRTTISLNPFGTVAVINGLTTTISDPTVITAPPILTIGLSTYTDTPGPGTTYIIGGQPLTPGGEVTIFSTTISLAPSATALVINGQSTNLNPLASTIGIAPILTIGGAAYTNIPRHGTTYVISGQTLTPGGEITISGTTISLSPSATEIVINGRTSNLMSAPASPPTNAPILTIGGQTYTDTPAPGTAYIISGQTLIPGGIITVSGTTISLSPSATLVVINNQTSTLFPATVTRATTGPWPSATLSTLVTTSSKGTAVARRTPKVRHLAGILVLLLVLFAF